MLLRTRYLSPRIEYRIYKEAQPVPREEIPGQGIRQSVAAITTTVASASSSGIAFANEITNLIDATEVYASGFDGRGEGSTYAACRSVPDRIDCFLTDLKYLWNPEERIV